MQRFREARDFVVDYIASWAERSSDAVARWTSETIETLKTMEVSVGPAVTDLHPRGACAIKKKVFQKKCVSAFPTCFLNCVMHNAEQL
jgi:hypothetical protein